MALTRLQLFTAFTALDAAVRAAAPVVSLRLLDRSTTPPTVEIVFDPAATAQQQTAANSVVTGFDWSDSAEATRETAAARTSANTIVATSPDAFAKAIRAAAAVLVDEINIVREWTVSFKAATAAATSLANLQTRVAALPDLPDRTLVQAKTAIAAKINSGLVD